jgi:hypothetical protein
VVAWFNPLSIPVLGRLLTDDSYTSSGGTNGMWGLSFGENGVGYVRFFFRGASQVTLYSNTILPLNVWCMAVGVRDPVAGFRKIYVNGRLDSQITSGDTAVFPPNTYPVTIGGEAPISPDKYFFKGYIAMVLAYNRVLSDTEIQQLYSSNIINASGLVLFLDATFYNSTAYIDVSGLGNHGIPYNVQRVPSNNTRLYIVKNLTQDGLVHLRFFPSGTKIMLSDGQTISLDNIALALGIRPNPSTNLYEDIPISPAFASSIVAFYVPKP